MENASKALIIAGAILLSILIISLGIMIYRQAAGVVNNNAMDELEITQFNSKFSQYFGSNITGANVNALINAVNSNNRLNSDDDSKIVEIKNGTSGDTSFAATATGSNIYKADAKTGKTYKIEQTAETSAGLISEITITAN